MRRQRCAEANDSPLASRRGPPQGIGVVSVVEPLGQDEFDCHIEGIRSALPGLAAEEFLHSLQMNPSRTYRE